MALDHLRELSASLTDIDDDLECKRMVRDFKSCPLLPTLDQLMASRLDATRPLQCKEAYHCIECYIASHFMVLREDMLETLRNAVHKARSEASRIQQNNVYRGMEFLHSTVADRRLHYRFTIDCSVEARQRLADKHLIDNNLGLLSCDNFKTASYVILVKGSISPKVVINLRPYEDGSAMKNLSKTTKYDLLEFPSLFAFYEHTLLALRNMTPEKMAFQNELVKLKFKLPITRRPFGACQLNMTSLTGDTQNNVISPRWPPPSRVELNEKQYSAVKKAVMNKFNVIQGPPGTGKTYTGTKLCDFLLKNKSILCHGKPLLVITQTNNALDHFLKALYDLGYRDIARLGRKCKVEELVDATEVQMKSIVYRDYGKLLGIIHALPIFYQSELLDQIFKVQEAGVIYFNERLIDSCQSREQLNRFLQISETKEINMREWLLSLDFMPSYAVFKEFLKALLGQQLALKTWRNDKDMRWGKDCFKHCHILEVKCLVEEYAESKAVRMRQREQVKLMMKKIKEQRSSVPRRWQIYHDALMAKAEKLEYKMASKAKDLHCQVDDLLLVKSELDSKALMTASVIGMTSTRASRDIMIIKAIAPSVIVFEEASQMTESHIVPLLCGEHINKIILIGDHKQLRPLPSAYLAGKHLRLDLSLFERLIVNDAKHTMLDVQHRMKPAIARLVDPFYDDLKDHITTREREPILGIDKDCYFMNHSYPEKKPAKGTSIINPREASMAAQIARHLIDQGYTATHITILSAYAAQVSEIQRQLKYCKERSQ